MHRPKHILRAAVLLALLLAALPAAADPGCRLDGLRDPVVHPGAAPRTVATELILGSAPADEAELVASVDGDRYAGIVADLSGAQAFELDGQMRTIRTRWAPDTAAPDGVSLAVAYLQDRLAAAGYEVQLQNFPVPGVGGTVQSTNVVAVRTGRSRPDEILVVGAHYDSISEIPSASAPGAEDNASGTAAVLHLAELLAGWKTDRTIHFVAFGSEENNAGLGLRGSRHYVQQALDANLQIVGALTMDMVSAWVDDFGVWIEGIAAFEPLMFAFRDNVTQWTSLPHTLHYVSFGSDHVPFQEAGIPAILAIEEDWAAYADYHRSTDTFDKVDPALGTEIVRAMAGSIADIAGIHRDVALGDPPPASRNPRLALQGAVPNPFNPRTVLHFSLPAAGPTRLEVLDLRGRRVRLLHEGVLGPGPHRRAWDGRDDAGRPVASGVYVGRLEHPEGIRSSRLTLVR